MKFKLDENLGSRMLSAFRSRGHDAQSVLAQGLQGCVDQRLYEICRDEHRCLVTLDLDFANVTRFPPGLTSGVVVMRVPRNPSPALLDQLAQQFLNQLSKSAVDKNLWIIEPGRIRVHDSEINE